ncbi:hypothetical protein G9A89_002068 [Geosiphon pyriformis]|nr:hypothetical protein G9A89_002068 [Geosiphon pyriformis]
MTNLAKQKDIIRWYLESGNMVSVLTETKLKLNVGFWIKNKFERVRIFTFGLEEGYVGAGMAIVMCGSLAYHVLKVEEVLGRVVSVCLLFKNKLLVTFLGLYAGALAKTRFAQASGINSFIFKAVNISSFVVISMKIGPKSVLVSKNAWTWIWLTHWVDFLCTN